VPACEHKSNQFRGLKASRGSNNTAAASTTITLVAVVAIAAFACC
jgi:hypothetical protein